MMIMDNNKSFTNQPLLIQSLKGQQETSIGLSNQNSISKQSQNQRSNDVCEDSTCIRRSVHATIGGGGAASQRSSAVLPPHHNINNNYLDNLSALAPQQSSNHLQQALPRIQSPKKQQSNQLLKRCMFDDPELSSSGLLSINPSQYQLGSLSPAPLDSQQNTNSIQNLPLQRNSNSGVQSQPFVNKLAAPKAIRGGYQQRLNSNNAAASSLLLNAAKWSQASPIKTENDQKSELLMEGRRQSSVQSQSEFQISDECFGSSGDNQSAARRINFQNEQNLSFIIQQDDEYKHRSNSPLKELQELLEVEQEFASIFNKSRAQLPIQNKVGLQESSLPNLKEAAMMRGTLNYKIPITTQHLSPDARTAADQSFSTLSCSSHVNFKKDSLFSSQITSGVASIERPSAPLYNFYHNADLMSHYSFATTNSQSLGGSSRFGACSALLTAAPTSVNFIHQIKRVSCNPFKKATSPEPSAPLNSILINNQETSREQELNIESKESANTGDYVSEYIKLEDQQNSEQVNEQTCNLQVFQAPLPPMNANQIQQEQAITIEDQQQDQDENYGYCTPEESHQLHSDYQSMMQVFGQMMTASPYAGYQNQYPTLHDNFSNLIPPPQVYSNSLENCPAPFQAISYSDTNGPSLEEAQSYCWSHHNQLQLPSGFYQEQQSVGKYSNENMTVAAMQDLGYIQYAQAMNFYQAQQYYSQQFEDYSQMGSDAFTQSLEGGQYLTNALYYEQYNNYHHGEEGKQIADDIGYTDSNGQE